MARQNYGPAEDELAAAQKVSGAADLVSSLSAKLTPQQIQYLDALQPDWQTAPCTWDEVLGRQ